MNYVDAGLIIVIVVFGFRGFASGFIKEVCSLIGIAVGVYLGSMFAVPVGEVLTQIHDFQSKSIHNMLGFLTVLGISWLFFMLLAYALTRQFTFLGLEFINKALGFVFACCKIFFIFSIFAYALSQISFIEENVGKIAREKSQIYVNMLKMAQFVIQFPDTSKQISQHLPQVPQLPKPELPSSKQTSKNQTNKK